MPSASLMAGAAVGGAVFGAGGLSPVTKMTAAIFRTQARELAQDERRAPPGTLLSAQDQDEGREGERFESDPEPDQQKVNYHPAQLRLSRQHTHHRLLLCGRSASRRALTRSAADRAPPQQAPAAAQGADAAQAGFPVQPGDGVSLPAG